MTFEIAPTLWFVHASKEITNQIRLRFSTKTVYFFFNGMLKTIRFQFCFWFSGSFSSNHDLSSTTVPGIPLYRHFLSGSSSLRDRSPIASSSPIDTPLCLVGPNRTRHIKQLETPRWKTISDMFSPYSLRYTPGDDSRMYNPPVGTESGKNKNPKKVEEIFPRLL